MDCIWFGIIEVEGYDSLVVVPRDTGSPAAAANAVRRELHQLWWQEGVEATATDVVGAVDSWFERQGRIYSTPYSYAGYSVSLEELRDDLRAAA